VRLFKASFLVSAMALWLSIAIGIGDSNSIESVTSLQCLISCSMARSHVASLQIIEAAVTVMYSALHIDRAIIVCFFKSHEIGASSSWKYILWQARLLYAISRIDTISIRYRCRIDILS
jgi:hypothetical protein